MRLPTVVERLLQQEDLNFFITNRVPRRLLTRCMGWFSRIEQPLVRNASIALFELFAGDLRLWEAKKPRFSSLHDCFIRELKDDARPLDPDPAVLVSPCDGIVGAFGAVEDDRLLQIKGSDYSLADLLGGREAAAAYRGGSYVTLRLTSNMYHRFHAPCACQVEAVTYIPGDFWNVNPTALKRLPGLYCRNERVAVHARLGGTGDQMALVAVGAILVGSVRLSFVERPSNTPDGAHARIPCAHNCHKGEELGYFHHGSTIVVLGTSGLVACGHLRSGELVRMGHALLRRR